MRLKLKDLKATRDFYEWKLKDKNLLEKQRDSLSLVLKSIEEIIKEKEKTGKKIKHKKYNQTAVF